MIERRTGRVRRPWNKPKRQMRKNILKKERNMYDLEVERRMKAKSVEIPPFMTAGPILVIVAIILSFLNNTRLYLITSWVELKYLSP